jgi:hypothetical protein
MVEGLACYQHRARSELISEVAAYIAANHHSGQIVHLPDIPSAAEVREKGVSLPGGPGLRQHSHGHGIVQGTVDGHRQQRLTSFSNRGFVLGSKQTTGGADYTFGYSYWAGGWLQTLTYPSQRQVRYSLDAAGRIQQAQNGTGTNAPSYASGILYEVQGGMKQMTLGNGIVETTNYSADRL